MSEHSRKRRDFIQNITIAVLCVSAVLLFAQTQVYNLGVNSNLFTFLSGHDLQVAPVSPDQTDTLLTAPVRIAAASTFGRYGNVTLSTEDEDFEPLRGLLEQALAAVDRLTGSTQEDFFAALETAGVYYDFLSPLPLSLLAGWYGMNFVNMPELHWKYGYPVFIVVSVAICVGLVVWFKKKKWF